MRVRRALTRPLEAGRSVWGVGIIWALSIVGVRRDKGCGVTRSVGGSGGAVGAPAAVDTVEQEVELSKSRRQLPVKPGPHHRPRTPLRRVGHTNLVAEAGVGGSHGGVEHVHLLQLHVTVELLQLRGLHALQLREVVLGEALKLAVHVVRVEVPVMVCRGRPGSKA